MFPIQQKFSEAAKGGLESGFAFYTALGGKTLESIEQLVALNLAAARASLEESAAVARQMLATRDAQEWMALVAAQIKPSAEKALAYGNHVANIANSSRSELGAVTERHIESASRKLHELVDEAARQAPPGVDSVVAAVKSVLDRAGDGYEQLSRAGKQAGEVLEVNLNAATRQLVDTAGLKV